MSNVGRVCIKSSSPVLLATCTILTVLLVGFQLQESIDYTQFNNNIVTNQNIRSTQSKCKTTTTTQSLSTPISELEQQDKPYFTSKNTTSCHRLWDWPMLDVWEQSNSVISTDSYRNTTSYSISRSNAHPTAMGKINMKLVRPVSSVDSQVGIEHDVPRRPLFPTLVAESLSFDTMINHHRRIVIYVTHRDANGANAWHRIAVQYMVWIAWNVVQHRYIDVQFWSSIKYIDVALPCSNIKDIKQGWSDLLFVNQYSDFNMTANGDTITTLWCTNQWHPGTDEQLLQGLQPAIQKKYGSNNIVDAILIPPNDGLLWDLAWDTNFHCSESHMFKMFLRQFGIASKPANIMRSSDSVYLETDNSLRMHQTLPQNTNNLSTVCWIIRYGNNQRDISNRDDVHGMLLSIFDTVQLIHATEHHTSAQIRNIMHNCHVIYGVHGAGMVNAMWATLLSQEVTAIVEILPQNKPQYFRSVSSLAGHYYISIVANERMEQQQYKINLEASSQALNEALSYVLAVKNETM